MFSQYQITVGRFGQHSKHFKGGAKGASRDSAALQQQAYADNKAQVEKVNADNAAAKAAAEAAAAAKADTPQAPMASPEAPLNGDATQTTTAAAQQSVSANRKGRASLLIEKSPDSGTGLAIV